jgi:hypothetical protein
MLELKFSHASTNKKAEIMSEKDVEKLIYNLQGKIDAIGEIVVDLAFRNDPDVLIAQLERIEEYKKQVLDENKDAHRRGYIAIENQLVVSLALLEGYQKSIQAGDSGTH